MGADCQIELKSGGLCGVPSIGRCATCERAFCRTHQAWLGQTYYIDKCAPCLAKERADEEKKWREREAEVKRAREYFRSGLARTALLNSNAQSVNIYWPTRKLKKVFWSYDWVLGTVHGRGWLLGEFLWSFIDLSSMINRNDYNPRNLDGRTPIVRNRLIALMDSDRYDLVCVDRMAEGYKIPGYPEEDGVSLYGNIANDSELLKVAQAVKRLVGP